MLLLRKREIKKWEIMEQGRSRRGRSFVHNLSKLLLSGHRAHFQWKIIVLKSIWRLQIYWGAHALKWCFSNNLVILRNLWIFVKTAIKQFEVFYGWHGRFKKLTIWWRFKKHYQKSCKSGRIVLPPSRPINISEKTFTS